MKFFPFWVAALVPMIVACAIPLNATPISVKRNMNISLAKEGKPTSTIYLAQKPTPAAAFAAAELQEHLRKITGAVIPISYDSERSPASRGNGTRILVGESAATRQLGIKPSALRNQEYLIRFLPNTLVLLGKDEPEIILNEPRQTAGRFNKAGSFDGSQRQRVFGHGFDDATGTFEGWVSIDGNAGEEAGNIFRLDGFEPWSYHIIQQEPNSRKVAYRVFLDGKGVWEVVSSPLSNGWHFFQATHSAADNKIQLFIDGVSQGTSSYSLTNCGDAGIDIGGSPSGIKVGNGLRGKLDDLRISNVVRPPIVPQQALVTDKYTTFLSSFDVPNRLKIDTATLLLPELFGERGTLDATYEFLERFCGVRWYLPTEIGTVVPNQTTLTVNGSEIRRAPAMRYREITATTLMLKTGGPAIAGRDTEIWKLRMRMGGEKYGANHSFNGYYSRFLKEHPDWFATTDAAQTPQLSYSNPEVIEQVVKDARHYFDGKGKYPGTQASGNYFALVPMDTDLWSEQDRLRFDKAEAENPQFSNGKASPVVWGFINQVAREVGKTHPDAYLSALSYWQYAYPPKDMALEPNIAVQMCLHTRNWWSSSTRRNDEKILNSWSQQEKGKRPLYLWLYYCFPGLAARSGKYNEFPGFFVHTIVEQMKLYRKAGIRGIFMEHSSEFGRSFLFDQLEMYVTWKLADDPTLDGEQLINEFFQKYYGSAAKPMQTMYEEIERVYSDPASYPQVVRDSSVMYHQTEELAWKYLGTPQRMARWEKLMVEAKTLARTPEERQRLELFDVGVWQAMKDGLNNYKIAAERNLKNAPEIERLKAQELPRVSVPKVADAGGDNSKVDWNAALKINQWSELAGLPAKSTIEMKLAHDDQFFYIELSDTRHGNTLVSNPNIFSGDDWELFFAAQRARPYHQFAWNPAGDSMSLNWTNKGESSVWNNGAKLQSTITAGGWNTRLTLSLFQLKKDDVVRDKRLFMNVYRSNPSAPALVWSSNFSEKFHDLSRMAEVTLE